MSHHRRLRTEHGVTLPELLVTIVIVGLAFPAVLGGIVATWDASEAHRQAAKRETLARAFAENVKAQPYVECAEAADYEAGLTDPAPPDGFTVAYQGEPKYWDGTDLTLANFARTRAECLADGDAGIQRIVLVLTYAETSATEELVVIKRNDQ